GVIGEAHLLNRLHDAPNGMIGVLLISGINFHLMRIQFFYVRRYTVPCRKSRITGSELGVGRDHAELLLSRERLLSQFVPALVKLAFVFVAPFLRYLVRRVRCPACDSR